MWFEDKARFGQKGTLTTVWAERGTRPTAPTPGAFGNLHVLAAACPVTGAADGLVRPLPNAPVVQRFRDPLSATPPAGTHRPRVWAGAGDHVAPARRVPADRTVLTRPADAPERNPVERRWLDLRPHHGSNRVYPAMADLAAVSGWRAVCRTAERIRTVCRCDYLDAGT